VSVDLFEVGNASRRGILYNQSSSSCFITHNISREHDTSRFTKGFLLVFLTQAHILFSFPSHAHTSDHLSKVRRICCRFFLLVYDAYCDYSLALDLRPRTRER